MSDITHRYARPQIMLHWLVVALLIIQFITHEGMEAVQDAMEIGQTPDTISMVMVQIHKWGGLLILPLAAIRVWMRFTMPTPPMPEGMTEWQQIAASVAHWALYGLLFAIPVTGAITVWVNEAAGDNHETLFKMLLAVTVLHVVAALWHQFIRKDNVFSRMKLGAG